MASKTNTELGWIESVCRQTEVVWQIRSERLTQVLTHRSSEQRYRPSLRLDGWLVLLLRSHFVVALPPSSDAELAHSGRLANTEKVDP